MHRWWHATATWRRASAAPPTAWSCGTSSGRRARRHKSWPWRSAISWRLTSETRACLRTSARRWSCSGWPSPPAWSSTMWTCAKSSTWATSSRWPTLTRWWKLVCKVNFSPMTFSAAEKRLYNTIFYFLPWVQIFFFYYYNNFIFLFLFCTYFLFTWSILFPELVLAGFSNVSQIPRNEEKVHYLLCATFQNVSAQTHSSEIQPFVMSHKRGWWRETRVEGSSRVSGSHASQWRSWTKTRLWFWQAAITMHF